MNPLEDPPRGYCAYCGEEINYLELEEQSEEGNPAPPACCAKCWYWMKR